MSRCNLLYLEDGSTELRVIKQRLTELKNSRTKEELLEGLDEVIEFTTESIQKDEEE